MKNSTKSKKKYIYNRLLNEKYILQKLKKEMSNYFNVDVINRFTLNYIKSDFLGSSHSISYDKCRYFYFQDFFSDSELSNCVADDRKFKYFDMVVVSKLIPHIMEYMLTIGDREKILVLRVFKDNKKIALSVINRNLWRLRGNSSDCIQIKCKLKRITI